MQTYIARSTIYLNKDKYPAGSKITLSDADAVTLLAKGHIAPADTSIVVVTPKVSGNTLEKFTLAELATYAADLNLSVPADATKATILALIAAAATAAETNLETAPPAGS